MVGNKIKVYTRSAKPDSKGYCWTTDGQGSYSLAEADNVAVGTKIVIELRDDCKQFASKIEVDSIIKKYSKYVMGLLFPILPAYIDLFIAALLLSPFISMAARSTRSNPCGPRRRTV
jgi:hypothetical protein